MTSTGPISTGVLCYLFADLFDECAVITNGEEVPASGAFVHPTAVACVAWGVTIHRLVHQEVLTLTPARRRAGLRTHPSLEVRGTGLLPDAPQGVDALVVAGLARRQTVYDLVRRWSGHWELEPDDKTVDLLREEAIAAGLGKRVPRFPRSFLESSHVLVWEREAIMRRWNEFSRLLSAWNQFRSEQREIADTLYAELGRALRDRSAG